MSVSILSILLMKGVGSNAESPVWQ